VQGVGFRPHIYRLAEKHGVGGWVKNLSGSVMLCFEGSGEAVNACFGELLEHPPKGAELKLVETVEIKTSGQREFADFRILDSDPDENARIIIPVDTALCERCRAEILDPADRRYRYPFTTCVECGPRYTVINRMPYDRERTVMSAFPLCDKCRKEYENPRDRRFHAETIACPECGPQLFLAAPDGTMLECGDVLQHAAAAIRNGKIIALRGIGGYQLAADAFNRETLQTLRRRKTRPEKPFALMARDLATVRKYCIIGEEEEQLLTSAAAPVVILDLQPEIAGFPADLISPDTGNAGFMLPYSPLHALLFAEDIPPVLVVTSGNRGGEPICLTNEEAFERLGGIADLVLGHNRGINLRNDDSVAAVSCGQPQVWRRARGYAPEPLEIANPAGKCVAAMGAELKNTITLAYENEAVISPHIGDLENPESLQGMKFVYEKLVEFLKRTPDAVAVDLHPDMHSTAYGESVAAQLGVPVRRVQHHHAHAAACMAEHGIEQALALVFDGTGYGPDGSIWGAELLLAEFTDFKRLATFAPAALPGGDAAVKRPARQLAARLFQTGASMDSIAAFMPQVKRSELETWQVQCNNKLNAPLSHAAGRLFDAFAALIGVAPETVSFEGQAAIRLETFARRANGIAAQLPELSFICRKNGALPELDWSPLFADFERFRNLDMSSKNSLALAFHHAVANSCISMITHALDSGFRTSDVVLSGGVFQNRLLVSILIPELEKLGLNVRLHRKVPPNDGGISLGQAVIALHQNIRTKN
jgi:hydrogenase maturation protein HypF